MNFYEKLVETSLPLARAKRIKRVCVGIHYTMVELETGGVGLVSTFWDSSQGFLELGEEVRFWNVSADIVIKKYLSSHPIENSIALATINAVFSLSFLEGSSKKMIIEDPFSEIELLPSDEILMIGYFEDFFNKLKSKVKKIWLLEKNWEIFNFEISQIKNKIKLAIVTSYLFLIKSLEKLWKEIEGIPEVIIIGPEIPLNSEIFKNTPVTYLLGYKVKNSEELFKRVCESKGLYSFLKAGLIEKIGLRIK